MPVMRKNRFGIFFTGRLSVVVNCHKLSHESVTSSMFRPDDYHYFVNCEDRFEACIVTTEHPLLARRMALCLVRHERCTCSCRGPCSVPRAEKRLGRYPLESERAIGWNYASSAMHFQRLFLIHLGGWPLMSTSEAEL
jgi:hypothetical protein